MTFSLALAILLFTLGIIAIPIGIFLLYGLGWGILSAGLFASGLGALALIGLLRRGANYGTGE